jgi:DNA-directed RNA polymerase subunit RPC12/RpoP
MTKPQDRDESLWEAIQTGHLRDQDDSDSELAKDFAAYRRLDSLFDLLRDPALSSFDATSQTPHWHPGERIADDYRVERLLGRGGMGEVYHVHRLSDAVAYAVKRAYRGSPRHSFGLTFPRLATREFEQQLVHTFDRRRRRATLRNRQPLVREPPVSQPEVENSVDQSRTPKPKPEVEAWANFCSNVDQDRTPTPVPEILRCANCGKHLRLPRIGKEIIVTCPVCRHRFSHKAQP